MVSALNYQGKIRELVHMFPELGERQAELAMAFAKLVGDVLEDVDEEAGNRALAAEQRRFKEVHDLYQHEDAPSLAINASGLLSGDKPLAKFQMFRDPGDPDVGIPEMVYWAMTLDQTGTEIADVVDVLGSLPAIGVKIVQDQDGKFFAKHQIE